MKIDIKRDSHVFISQQIRQQISDWIRSGFIDGNTALPSIRSLADQHGISPVTVSKAYKLLEEDGLIKRIHGLGTYVKEVSPTDNETQSGDDDPYGWQNQALEYMKRAQFSKEIHIADRGFRFNLSEASVAHSLLPTREIVQKASDILTSQLSMLNDYGAGEGDLEFRKALRDYFAWDHINTDYENIIVTNGAQQALHLIASIFLQPGDKVLIEETTYPGMIDILTSMGVHPIQVPMDGDGILVHSIYDLCEKHQPKMIYTIPRYHNPTGISLTEKRKRQLLEIAQAYDLIVIEDDPWSDVSFERCKPKPLKSYDRTGHVIYVKGFSKIIGPTYRLGAIVADGKMLTCLMAAKSCADLGSPILVQKLVEPFFKSGRVKSYTKRLQVEMANRRNLACSLLEDHAPKALKWNQPLGGLNLWLTLPNECFTESVLVNLAHTLEICYIPGAAFYFSNTQQNHLRISYSYLEKDDLREAILKLCEAVNEALEFEKNHRSE